MYFSKYPSTLKANLMFFFVLNHIPHRESRNSSKIRAHQITYLHRNMNAFVTLPLTSPHGYNKCQHYICTNSVGDSAQSAAAILRIFAALLHGNNLVISVPVPLKSHALCALSCFVFQFSSFATGGFVVFFLLTTCLQNVATNAPK